MGEQQQKHIYVVDGAASLLALVRERLEGEGYRVTTDGFTGDLLGLLRRVKSAQPDLLVLDFVIQNEGIGWQFLQILRMDRATRGIPIVACTTAVTTIEALGTHLERMGVVALLKPFDIDHLLQAIGKTADFVPSRR